MGISEYRIRAGDGSALEWPVEIYSPIHRVVQLKGILPLQIRAYHMIRQDLLHAREWIADAEDGVPDVLASYHPSKQPTERTKEFFRKRQPLFVAGITFYGKCFMEAKGRNGVVLDRSSIKGDFRSVHDSLMLLRHNLTAHAGLEKFEDAAIFCLMKDNNDGTYLVSTQLGHQQTSARTPISGSTAPSYLNLIDHVLALVAKKISLLEKDLDDSVAAHHEVLWVAGQQALQTVELPLLTKSTK